MIAKVEIDSDEVDQYIKVLNQPRQRGRGTPSFRACHGDPCDQRESEGSYASPKAAVFCSSSFSIGLKRFLCNPKTGFSGPEVVPVHLT